MWSLVKAQSATVPTGDALGYRIPRISVLDSTTYLRNQATATVSVRHNHKPIALGSVSEKPCSKTPVTSPMTEIPALANLTYRKPDGVWPDTDGTEHLTNQTAIEHRSLTTSHGFLHIDGESRQIRRRRP